MDIKSIDKICTTINFNFYIELEYQNIVQYVNKILKFQ